MLSDLPLAALATGEPNSPTNNVVVNQLQARYTLIRMLQRNFVLLLPRGVRRVGVYLFFII